MVMVAIRDIQPGEEMLDTYASFESDSDNDNILREIAEKYFLVDEMDPWLKYYCSV